MPLKNILKRQKNEVYNSVVPVCFPMFPEILNIFMNINVRLRNKQPQWNFLKIS